MTGDVEIVRKLGERLAALPAPGEDEQALLGFAVGAAYSLEQALRLGYLPAKAGTAYADEVRAAAMAVSHGDVPARGAWLAGYYFNSALFRLAALGERIGKYAVGRKWDPAPGVRRDVNHLKHDVDVLLTQGREATAGDAQNALREVVAVLELLFLQFRGPDRAVEQ